MEPINLPLRLHATIHDDEGTARREAALDGFDVCMTRRLHNPRAWAHDTALRAGHTDPTSYARYFCVGYYDAIDAVERRRILRAHWN